MRQKPLRSNPGKTAAWHEKSQAAARRRERKKPRSPIEQPPRRREVELRCWLAKFDPDHECEGSYLQRTHLVKEQFLRDEVGLSMEERWNRDYWVEACPGHNRRLDHLDFKLTRAALPARLERAADRHPKIAARLTRDSGPRFKLIERAA
jgi:hypothetical protein